MKYSLTKRDIGILLGFFGLVILGLTYYFVYRGYTAKTAELVLANDAMQARVEGQAQAQAQMGQMMYTAPLPQINLP